MLALSLDSREAVDEMAAAAAAEHRREVATAFPAEACAGRCSGAAARTDGAAGRHRRRGHAIESADVPPVIVMAATMVPIAVTATASMVTAKKSFQKAHSILALQFLGVLPSSRNPFTTTSRLAPMRISLVDREAVPNMARG